MRALPLAQSKDARQAPLLRRHWLGIPITETVEGSIDDISRELPHFGRQPFAMTSVNGDEVGVNRFMDMVYRMATRQGERSIPIGVVSKNYRLVDHQQVLSTVEQALIASRIAVDQVQVSANWTVHGERAHFSFLFPDEPRFVQEAFGGGDQMRFRVEVFNSVDGSSRFVVLAGWLRFVCSNGLVIGSALVDLRKQHRRELQIEEVGKQLREAIRTAEADKQVFAMWKSRPIDPAFLAAWADMDVKEQWGLKAAVRVLGIAKTGCDVEIAGDLKLPPSQIKTKQLGTVPGMDGRATNIFDVSQALSWLAGQRSDPAEDLQWRIDVSGLIDKLIQMPKQLQLGASW